MEFAHQRKYVEDCVASLKKMKRRISKDMKDHGSSHAADVLMCYFEDGIDAKNVSRKFSQECSWIVLEGINAIGGPEIIPPARKLALIDNKEELVIHLKNATYYLYSKVFTP